MGEEWLCAGMGQRCGLTWPAMGCHPCAVSPQLAVPHNDEWTRFARTLVEIRANRADSEEEGAVELAA